MTVRTTRRWLLASVFALVLVEGLFVQFILLPHIVSGLHAGDGLLKGLDSVGFLETARVLALRIGEEGWSAWIFRTDHLNTVPSLAAIVYVYTTPEPYVLLPVNAVLWALTAIIWFDILRRLVPSLESWGALGALLIVLMPSAMTWTTQFHKDIFSIPGISLALLAMVRALMFRRTAEAESNDADSASVCRELTLDLILVVMAAAMVWMVRPYLLQLPAAGAGLLVPVLIVFAIVRWLPRLNLAITLAVIVAFAASSFVGNRYFSGAAGEYLDASREILKPFSSRDALLNASGSSDGNSVESYGSSVANELNTPSFGPFDKAARILGGVRAGYCASANADAGSAIDCDVQIRTFLDLLAYSPRAAQIAFFAPFPDIWLSNGKAPGGNLMRVIAGFEMTLAYLVFLAGFIALVSRRARLSIPIVAALIYLIVPMMIIVVANPNLGTIYRMRYVFFMGVAAIAFSLALQAFLHWKGARRA